VDDIISEGRDWKFSIFLSEGLQCSLDIIAKDILAIIIYIILQCKRKYRSRFITTIKAIIGSHWN
jgi:hypothetical protein